MNILVLGFGFVGISIKSYIEDLNNNYNSLITLSSRDISYLHFGEYDLIIHAAASSDPKKSNENPIKYFEESVETTKLVYYKILNENPDTKYIYISSGCINYSSILDITNSYLESKRIGELYTGELLCKGVKAKIIRLFSVIGPYINLQASLAINSFIRNGMAKQDLIVSPNAPNIIRSYLYADEMVEQILNSHNNLIFRLEVGSSDKISILELANMISNYYKVAIKVDDVSYYSNTVDYQIPNYPLSYKLSSEEAILKTLEQLKQ